MKTFCYLLQINRWLLQKIRKGGSNFQSRAKRYQHYSGLFLSFTNSDSILLEDENSQANQGTTVVTFTNPTFKIQVPFIIVVLFNYIIFLTFKSIIYQKKNVFIKVYIYICNLRKINKNWLYNVFQFQL
jgi:hypothetical protein